MFNCYYLSVVAASGGAGAERGDETGVCRGDEVPRTGNNTTMLSTVRIFNM